MVISASCSHEVPILMEVWEQRLITADPVIISAGWLILAFVLSSGLHFKPGNQRADFSGAKRNILCHYT